MMVLVGGRGRTLDELRTMAREAGLEVKAVGRQASGRVMVEGRRGKGGGRGRQTVRRHYAETVYYDGAFLWGGQYWGGWGRRGWWGGGGYWGRPYPVGPVNTYDRFRVEFRDNKVVAFNQELAR